MSRFSIVILFTAIILAVSCKKPDEYPVIPAISFKSIYTVKDAQGYDLNVYVVVSFTDGDGDLGLYPAEDHRNDPIFDDPLSPYYNDFIVTAFINNSGSWDTIPVPVSSRMPYLTPSGANKGLKGDILRQFNVPPSLNDSLVRYDIFIYDRALHKSNMITTPAISLKTH